jgi:hypothetical protein
MSVSVKTLLGVSTERGFRSIASGSLTNGAKVVVNTDGTVSAVVETPYNLSNANTISSSAVTTLSCCYDTVNNKVVVSYSDPNNNNYGTSVVGTVSGINITFGTPVVFLSQTLNSISSCFDTTNGKVIIAYTTGYAPPGGANLRGIVGTVSGNSISFGTPSSAVAESYWGTGISIVYDSNEDAVLNEDLPFDIRLGYRNILQVNLIKISTHQQLLHVERPKK